MAFNYTVTSDSSYVMLGEEDTSDYTTVQPTLTLSAPTGVYNYNNSGEDTFNSIVLICPETNKYNEGTFTFTFQND